MRHRPAGAALNGEDRLGGNARTDAAALPTAAKFLDDAADRPRHHELRVIRDRFFEIDPGLRQACEVDGQYEWFHIRFGASVGSPSRSRPLSEIFGYRVCPTLVDSAYAPATWRRPWT